jgi:RHS repeat-associated protein
MDLKRQQEPATTEDSSGKDLFAITPPTIALPKGGGAMRGIGEKFAANPVTGTGSTTIPIAATEGRHGFGPQLSLQYDSGAGNGPFGIGWSLSIPSITRKTDKGLPRYRDADESDVFMLGGTDDLVPVPDAANDQVYTLDGVDYRVQCYQPRIEKQFARIERWTRVDSAVSHWRTIAPDSTTNVFGTSDASRIADPDDALRVFGWLLDTRTDDKGNAIVFEYRSENSDGVDLSRPQERNRTDQARSSNRYLKRITYGNTPSRLVQPNLASLVWHFEIVFDYGEHDADRPAPDDTGSWICRRDCVSAYRAGFEIRTQRLCQRVLMFHRFDELGAAPCLVRSTDFTYRTDTPGGDTHTGEPAGSFIASVTQAAYVRRADGSYLRDTMPPLDFTYSRAAIDQTVRTIDDADHLPIAVDGRVVQWVDLDGEGLSGMLTPQSDAWFYKRNLGAGRFAATERVASTPPMTDVVTGRQQLLDLVGDGTLDLVALDRPTPGYFHRTAAGGWDDFMAFESVPNVPWTDPNLRMVDLTGDGHPDVVITDDDVITWYPSRAQAGFGPAERTPRSVDDETGPRVVFADSEQKIYLADLSGDGLSDLVRIRNGDVCYWPNLGYGRFGAKVTMANAPWLDAPDLFDERRIRLADVDGSGTADLLYIGRREVTIWFNEAGNSWSAPTRLTQLPRMDDVSFVKVADLLGTGTACLAWASPLSGDARQPIRYIDLMGGQKPHLMVAMSNNLGATTTVQYAPSTKFYLADRARGAPWITRLAFPVHCVEAVGVTDAWRQTTFRSTYSYHHGFYDGVEREFRGFGRVERIDVESYGLFAAGAAASPYITADRSLYQPPIKTITWYHTGASLEMERILRQFEREYFPASLAAQANAPAIDLAFGEKQLPDADLESGLSGDEWREALRSCKGQMLRQESYELDVDALEQGVERSVRLYSTEQHAYRVRRLRPCVGTRHAVFLTVEAEAAAYQYELDLRPAQLEPDPRVTHTLNLSFDDQGHVQQSIAVTYPRVRPFVDPSLSSDVVAVIQAAQAETHLVYTETRHTTDAIDLSDAERPCYRLRQPCDVQTGVLTGLSQPSGFYFDRDELQRLDVSVRYSPQGAAPAVPVVRVPYHALPPDHAVALRIVEQVRTLFWNDALADPLPLGTLGALGLVYERYKLALTSDLLDAVFGAAPSGKLDASLPGGGTLRGALDDPAVCGYAAGVQLATLFAEPGIGEYWLRSGTIGFAPDAAQRFYWPERYTDAFGGVTTLTCDDKYALYVASSADARGNTATIARWDFRLLVPAATVDANGNISEAVFDTLGMPTAIAVEGKGNEGDRLDAFDEALIHPSADLVVALFTTDYDESLARQLLAGATARHLYYWGELRAADGTVTWAQHPPCTGGILRETHVAALPPGAESALQAAFEYFDGAGGSIVKKVQAEPETDGGPVRWIASGKTIRNNKGKVVKQYEPYFSDVAQRFEEPVEAGVTAVIYYDAAGRVVRTEQPDGSFSRTEFSPWHASAFDANDTVLEPGNGWYAAHSDVTASAAAQRAAQLASVHAATPSVSHLDSLGRDVVAIGHNRWQYPGNATPSADERDVTFTRLDAEGKPLWIRDARGNLVVQHIYPPMSNNQAADATSGFAPCYDIAGHVLFEHSMDAGGRWTLYDAVGKAIAAWDTNERRDDQGTATSESRFFFSRYDVLHRPVEHWLAIDAGAPQLIGRLEYIDMSSGVADAQVRNMCGQLYRHYDASGLTEVERMDFAGELVEVHRRLASDYKAAAIDWQTTPASDPESKLEVETFVQLAEHDALKRPTRLYEWHHGVGSRVAVHELYYNARGVLDHEDLVMRATKTADGYTEGPDSDRSTPIQAIAYDAKGQRQRLVLGNGTVTHYAYDPQTFRLVQMRTTRPGFDPAFPSAPLADARVLQDLSYTYDPVGNITEIYDAAYAPAFFANQQVDPQARYTYDARYRLIAASGREDATAASAPSDSEPPAPQVTFPIAGANALRRYTQTYVYDSVGNLLQVQHATGGTGSWTRAYEYSADSNRLSATSTGNPLDAVAYAHDAHGNVLNLANVPAAFLLRWDYRDLLQMFNRGGGGRVYYTYAADKQRARKVAENQAGTRKDWERLYLGGFEIYRRFDASGLVEEIESVHVMDGDRRVALVEDVLQSDATALGALYRYQYSNLLGSACLELDEASQVITYEEYHPYGTSSFRGGRTQAEVALKRYRYTGMERDQESGLMYHGARYYAPWIARWTAADPTGIRDGLNVYAYVKGNPIAGRDTTGTETNTPQTATDRKVMQMTQKQLLASLKGMNPIERYTFLNGATGMFQARIQANIQGSKLAVEQPVRIGVTTVEHIRPEPAPPPPSLDPITEKTLYYEAVMQGLREREAKIPTFLGFMTEIPTLTQEEKDAFTWLGCPGCKGATLEERRDEYQKWIYQQAALAFARESAHVGQTMMVNSYVSRTVGSGSGGNRAPVAHEEEQAGETAQPRPAGAPTGSGPRPTAQNPSGGTNNCVPVAIAYDIRRRGGNQTSMPTDTAGPTDPNAVRGYAGKMEQSMGTGYRAKLAIGDQLRKAGPGSGGIVWGNVRNPTPGTPDAHAFNVENVNGVVRFTDAQSGKPAENFGVYDQVFFWQTN